MFRVLSCIATEHDIRLVVLAAFICAMAAFTSFRIYARATNARALQDRQYRRVAWLGLTGLSTGAGIWSTHFVAMLAYDSGFPTAYDPTLTLVSLVIAIGVTTIGYLISVEGRHAASIPSRFNFGALGPILASHGADARAAVGGAVVGAGIGAMHYTGMAALIVPGAMEWNKPHVVASVILGIALASAGMVANRRLEPRKGRARIADDRHLLPALHGNGRCDPRSRSNHHCASVSHQYRRDGVRCRWRHDAGDAGGSRCRARQRAG